MAVPFSNTKLRVPKGFQNILECLAREVLRSQPDNINEFAAAYFESLLRVRIETGHDPAVHGARLDDRNYNNELYKKRPADPHETQQRSTGATTIQSKFRQNEAKEEVLTLREEDAAIKIQAGFRGHIIREHVRKLKDDLPDKVPDDDVDIDLTCPDVEKAAIRIQAGFKGFKARKEAVAAPEEASKEITTDDETVRDVNDPDVNRAASKIQAGFRGHTTRKQLKEVEAQKQPEEEVIDIDLDDPDVKKSAALIQAGFKGLKARKHLKQKAEEQQQMEEQEESQRGQSQQEESPRGQSQQEESPRGQSQQEESPRGQSQQEESPRGQSQQEESQQGEQNSASEKADQEEPATDDAALKIQAAFRGYSTRKSMKETAEQPTPQTAEASDDVVVESSQNETEEVDIDLTDPAVQSATMKLQAGFKGFKARKEMQAKAELLKTADAASNERNDGDENKNNNGVTATEDDGAEAAEGGVVEEAEAGRDDDSKESAITKIQAGFRGMKARERVKAIHQSKNEAERSEEEQEEAAEDGEGVSEEEPDEM